ncbi:MAG TPA: hypothetical protein PKB07_01570 [Flavilitoribacter sp.]|nr:hypothetical protein [Flavilitoribacter sp.]
MKKANVFVLTIFMLAAATSVFAQSDFRNCSAAFLNGKMVVDQYTDDGKCILSQKATGELTVCTAELFPDKSIPKDKIEFKIAIRDKNTGTLTMFSADPFVKADMQEIMAKCTPGDHIVLITMAREYALPHNEILVN